MADHDDALAEAVKAWTDAELAEADADEFERGTFAGEWLLIASRQGMTADGEPTNQWFTTGDGGPTRQLGLAVFVVEKLKRSLLAD